MKTIILEQPETETILAKDADVSNGILTYDGSKFIGLVTEYGDGFCIYRTSGKSDYYAETLADMFSNKFTFKQLS